ncbi:MAG: sugar phosphate isomerase/epimerase family protein [Vicinamibacterales bacterium]
MATRQFGVSTHLYHHQRLAREHLLEIAAYGFDTVILCATRTHFDYHSQVAVANLQQWLAEAGLTLHGMHAPVAERYDRGRFDLPLSLASADPDARRRAVVEAEAALHVARRIEAKVLVTHLGLPRSQPQEPGTQGRVAARRSIEELLRTAEPLGVRIALEVMQNELSRATSLVHFVEEDLDGSHVGICLDLGHAHLEGDLLDAIDAVSEHLVLIEAHDNLGRADDHLAPFDGTIDWPAALTAVQKVGYDGAIIFELAPQGPPKETLQRARKARERMERLLA